MIKQHLKTILLIVIVALYIAVRLWDLTDSCLWFDEIFSVHAAQNNWNVFFSFIAQDLIHPPLFYLLLKLWLFVFGESLFAARLFPLTFSVFSILPFVMLCRELKLSRIEICFGLLMLAVNGSLIKYSQEVRMYSLLLFLSLCSSWIFLRWLNSGKTVRSSYFNALKNLNFIFLLLTNVLLIYTHYFGWLIVLAELVITFWKREKIREFSLQFLSLLLVFAPWVTAIIYAAKKNQGFEQNLNGNLRPDLQRIWEFISALHQPFYYQQSNLENSVLLISIPISLGCGSLIFYGFIKNYKESQFQFPAILFLVTFAVSFIASWILPASIWGIRHLTIIFPVYFIILALSFRLLPGSIKNIFFSLILMLLLISGWLRLSNPKPVYIWCAWENLAAHVAQTDTEKPVVFAFEDLVAYHLWFAASGKFQVVKINGYTDMPEDKAYFLPRGFYDVEVRDKSSIDGDYFWLAFRQESSIPDKKVLDNLRSRGYEIGEPFRFEAQGLTAFMIPVRKTPLSF